VQLPLPNRVVFERTAYVRPLLAVLDEARPAGIIMVSRSGVRLCEWKLGATDELARWRFEPETEEWRESKAKPSRSPSPGQQIALERDRFERRLDEARRRFFVQSRTPSTASPRPLLRLLLAGDPRLTGPRQALPEGCVATSRASACLEDLDRHALGSRGRRAAAPSGAASATCRARPRCRLANGAGALTHRRPRRAQPARATLLLDGAREWNGLMEPDGRLWPEGTRPEDVPSGEVAPEPFLAERMIEQALARGATVAPVEQEAAAQLADFDGMAAILRWKG
jgi:hypothetical protein